jgi:hypothetical protein
MSTEWYYTKRSLGGYIVFEDWDKPICAVNDEEHARMIAAAPEMLEALQAIAATNPNNTPMTNDQIRNAYAKALFTAKAAIAKAKGEAP